VQKLLFCLVLPEYVGTGSGMACIEDCNEVGFCGGFSRGNWVQCGCRCPCFEWSSCFAYYTQTRHSVWCSIGGGGQPAIPRVTVKDIVVLVNSQIRTWELHATSTSFFQHIVVVFAGKSLARCKHVTCMFGTH